MQFSSSGAASSIPELLVPDFSYTTSPLQLSYIADFGLCDHSNVTVVSRMGCPTFFSNGCLILYICCCQYTFKPNVCVTSSFWKVLPGYSCLFACLSHGLFLTPAAQILATAIAGKLSAPRSLLTSRYCTGSGRLKSHVVVSCVAVRLSHGLRSLATVEQHCLPRCCCS